MKRTTISLPDDLAVVVERESRRRGVSISALAREALAERLQGHHEVPFGAVGRSGDPTGSERIDDLLAAAWADDIEEDRGE